VSNLTSDGGRVFDYDSANRLAQVKLHHYGEEAAIAYLHNAQGQRVFKGEPRVLNYQPMDLKVPKVVTTGYPIRILVRVAQVTRFEGIIATQPMCHFV